VRCSPITVPIHRQPVRCGPHTMVVRDGGWVDAQQPRPRPPPCRLVQQAARGAGQPPQLLHIACRQRRRDAPPLVGRLQLPGPLLQPPTPAAGACWGHARRWCGWPCAYLQRAAAAYVAGRPGGGCSGITGCGCRAAAEPPQLLRWLRWLSGGDNGSVAAAMASRRRCGAERAASVGKDVRARIRIEGRPVKGGWGGKGRLPVYMSLEVLLALACACCGGATNLPPC